MTDPLNHELTRQDWQRFLPRVLLIAFIVFALVVLNGRDTRTSLGQGTVEHCLTHRMFSIAVVKLNTGEQKRVRYEDCSPGDRVTVHHVDGIFSFSSYYVAK